MTGHGHPIRRAVTAALGILMVLTVASCGSSTSGGTATTTPTGPETTTAASAPADASSGSTVEMVDISFKPHTLHVAKGTVVTFTNDDIVPHDVTADSGPVHSPTLKPGQTWTWTATGTLEYHCSIHPNMTATIDVS